ncbi:hypothetical protein KZZ52_32570 [Dactylosporangium sp. AC04546]|nr:hypothetical protein [Dactylosporangium sp. AC04546]WVK78727.1 hypothetical protein KZZ52_32570 [Dactylosporangium sp. AC04546]
MDVRSTERLVLEPWAERFRGDLVRLSADVMAFIGSGALGHDDRRPR